MLHLLVWFERKAIAKTFWNRIVKWILSDRFEEGESIDFYKPTEKNNLTHISPVVPYMGHISLVPILNIIFATKVMKSVIFSKINMH